MTIRPEGWCYLVVLMFVVWAAVLREINLLVLLAGMMLGPLAISWRLAALSMRRLELDRALPPRPFAGELSPAEVIAANRRGRLGAWTVVVEDQIQLLNPDGGRRKARVQVMFPHIGAGGVSRVAYQVLFHRRGRYRFGPFRVFTRFPLGLVQAAATSSTFHEVIVCPPLGALTQKWTEAIEADRVGEHHWHRRHGVMEGDYYSVREWRQGDSKRWLHWRTTARLGRPAVRQFEHQASRDVALILDLWRPDHPTEKQSDNVEVAVSMAATAVADLCRRGSRLFLAVAGRQRCRWSVPAASPFFEQEVLEQLAVVEAASDSPLADAAEEVLEELRPAGQVIVISTRSASSAGSGSWSTSSRDRRRRATIDSLLWIDVGDDNLSGFFHPPGQSDGGNDGTSPGRPRRRISGVAGL